MNILGKLNEIHLTSEEDTARFAKILADGLSNLLPLNAPINYWLIGDLGAGKTTFTRYLLKSLGHSGKVKSPTYNLCEPYKIQTNLKQLEINHFDLYRMTHPKEWEESGFRDTLSSPGLSLIEWPEKAEGTLPQPDLTIRLNYLDENSRTINIEAYSNTGQKLIQQISENRS